MYLNIQEFVLLKMYKDLKANLYEHLLICSLKALVKNTN